MGFRIIKGKQSQGRDITSIPKTRRETMAVPFSIAVALLFLQIVLQANAQSVVDNDKYCKKLGLICGGEDSPNSEKYCCAESNGGFPVYRCCNPYIGLFIGLGVGIPVVIIIIVLVVVLYCWCVRYQNRKMQVLLESYEREENTRERTTEDTNFVAPPAYTPLKSEEEVDPDAGLPPYSESDPFTSAASHPPPSAAAATELERNGERTATASAQRLQFDDGDGDQGHGEVVEVELEDVPLISDDDEQQN